MRKTAVFALLVLAVSSSCFGEIHSWKGTVHIIGVPFIAAAGIYSSSLILRDAEHPWTKAGAVVDLAAVAAQAALGGTMLFGSDDLPPVIRKIHRIVGITVIASGLWISVAGSLDDGVASPTRYVAYGHTVLASVPLILFGF